MVELVDGQGKFYRDVLQENRRQTGQYSSVHIYPEEQEARKRLVAGINNDSHIDEHTLWVFNVIDIKYRELEVASGPHRIKDFLPQTEGVPLPTEGTYLVTAYNSYLDANTTIPVIVDNEISAGNIAMRILRARGWHRSTTSVVPLEVPSDEFLEGLRQDIRAGKYIHERLLIYEDLRELQREVRAARFGLIKGQ